MNFQDSTCYYKQSNAFFMFIVIIQVPFINVCNVVADVVPNIMYFLELLEKGNSAQQLSFHSSFLSDVGPRNIFSLALGDMRHSTKSN